MLSTVQMDYRDLIRTEFQRRRKTNVFYSLRAFAKDLELSPMHLSLIMRNKRGLSRENARRVAYLLGITGIAAQRVYFLAAAQNGRSKFERNSALQALEKKDIRKAKDILLHYLKNETPKPRFTHLSIQSLISSKKSDA